MQTKIEELADELIEEIQGRKGIGDEWDQIDEEIQQEIRDSFVQIITEKVSEVLGKLAQ